MNVPMNWKMSARIVFLLTLSAWMPFATAQLPTPAPAPVPTPAPAAAPPAVGAPGAPATEPSAVQPTLTDDKDTILAAEKWLLLLDTGKIGAAWDTAAPHLQSVVTRKKWIEGITAARKPFGKLASRTAEKFARAHQLPGAPDGDYSIVEFTSKFKNGKVAAEQVIWMLGEGDVWRVSGYFIR